MLLSCMKEDAIGTGDGFIVYNKSHVLPLTIVGKLIDVGIHLISCYNEHRQIHTNL